MVVHAAVLVCDVFLLCWVSRDATLLEFRNREKATRLPTVGWTSAASVGFPIIRKDCSETKAFHFPGEEKWYVSPSPQRVSSAFYLRMAASTPIPSSRFLLMLSPSTHQT